MALSPRSIKDSLQGFGRHKTNPMRIFLLLLLLAPFFSFSQTDSTSIKLNQYKEWHDKGTINDAEYAKLKSDLLGFKINNQGDTVNTRITPQVYKSKIIAGSIFTGIGVCGFVGLAAYISKDHEYRVTDPNETVRTGAIIGVGSALVTVLGGVLLGVGLHQKQLYKAEHASLDLKLDNNGIGLAMRF